MVFMESSHYGRSSASDELCGSTPLEEPIAPEFRMGSKLSPVRRELQRLEEGDAILDPCSLLDAALGVFDSRDAASRQVVVRPHVRCCVVSEPFADGRPLIP